MDTTTEKPPFTHCVERVADWVKRHLADGCVCPACGRTVKLYRRRIDVSMAKTLLLLVDLRLTHRDQRWHHPESYADEHKLDIYTRTASLMRYWGLVARPKRVAGQNHTGRLRATDVGVAFARGDLRVHKYALLYNDACQGLTGPLVSFADVMRSGGFTYTPDALPANALAHRAGGA
jgi:hypothetical protein